MTLSWSAKLNSATNADLVGSQNLIISEINENNLIPYISNILGDTCPPNYNHQITIYGQNFRPDSTVNIPGASNIITTIISPTEIIAQFTSGSIVGAFDIEVVNDGKSSALWGQNNKLNIINATGGDLPLLDTWIDCRINGSPDALIGNIEKDNDTTWTRGIFGYTISAQSTSSNNWGYYFRFTDYSFPRDLPIAVEIVIYESTRHANIRWGLHANNDLLFSQAPAGFINMPSNFYSFFAAGWFTAPKQIQFSMYDSPPIPLNQYIKIKFAGRNVSYFVSNHLFESVSLIKEYIIPSDYHSMMMNIFEQNGVASFLPAIRFNPSGTNLSNYSHLTAFKLSWA